MLDISQWDNPTASCRVLSTGGGGGGGGEGAPPPKKSFPEERKLKLLQIKICFDDDFKESVKLSVVINVQKCDFSQS